MIEDKAVDDARIDQLIRRLEERPPLRPEFTTTLRDRLAGELGFGRAGRRRLGFAQIAAAAPWQAPWPQLRTAWIIALVALLAAALVGALAVGSRLLAPDPSELVRLSRAAYDDPPAFTETFRDPTGSMHRLSADGAGTWRIEPVPPNAAGSGSYDLFDGTRVGHYDGPGRVWTSGSLAEMSGGLPPFPFDNEFTWSRVETRADGSLARVPASCEGAELLDEAPVVAGRTTHHLRCPDTGMEVWLDRQTHLILRLEAGLDTAGWEPRATVEVTVFSLGAPPDTTAFSFDGPKDALKPEDQPPSHSLEVGDPMPDLYGPLVGGGTFHTASLSGRPTAVFVWCPCVNGPELRLFSNAVGRRADHLGAAVVLEATAADAAATIADVAFNGPAIIDEGGVINPLGLNYWPVLVLVDPEGRIASLSHQVRDPAELDAMLDALLAGAPIPAPTWIPGSGDAPGASTVLQVGQVAPDWSVPMEDGRTLAARDLVGTRTIVYYGLPQGGDDLAARNAAILEELDVARRADPRLRLVVVDAVAATRDAAQAALDGLGVSVSVIADRDGVIGSAWGLAYYPSLVFLDESGRVAWYGAGACIDVAALVQPFEDGSPMPSPALEPGAPNCP